MSFRHPVVFGIGFAVCGRSSAVWIFFCSLMAVQLPRLYACRASAFPADFFHNTAASYRIFVTKKNAFCRSVVKKALKLDAPQRAIYHYVMPCLCAGLTMHTIDGTRRMFTPWSTFFSDEGRRYLRRSIELALDEDGPDLTAQGLLPLTRPCAPSSAPRKTPAWWACPSSTTFLKP